MDKKTEVEMKNFPSIAATIFVFVLFFVSVSGKDLEIKPREKSAAAMMRSEYIFVNEKTPEYLLKNALSKGFNPAFLLKGSDAAWMREKLEIIKKSSPLIFVMEELSGLEKKYLEELVKFTDYRAQIICLGNCSKGSSWRHPLIKRLYSVTREENGRILMEGLGKRSYALKNSALDEKSFVDSPLVRSGIYFREFSFAFISLDSNVEGSFFKDASIVVYYSDSEKKMSDFVEKKF
jgi:hypothetical protein